jgi:hypothetical protein
MDGREGSTELQLPESAHWIKPEKSSTNCTANLTKRDRERFSDRHRDRRKEGNSSSDHELGRLRHLRPLSNRYLNSAYEKEALADVIFQNYFELGGVILSWVWKSLGVIIPLKLTAERIPNVIQVQHFLNYRLFSRR